VLFRNRLISRFPKDALLALEPDLHEVSLGKDETIVEAGSPVSTLYFPSTAVISEVVVLSDGRMLETDTVGFEGVVGLMAVLTDTPQLTRSFAQIAGSAIAVDAKVLKGHALANPQLFMLLMRGLLLVHLQLQQGAACLAHHVLHRRMARWLLTTADRTGTANFPLTQEYLSFMLGTQRTTVNAAAADLKKRGVIRYSRGNVTILDRAALEQQACECYRTIHQIEEEIDGAPIRAFSG
jgi:CRP-like cAMP-binding protein